MKVCAQDVWPVLADLRLSTTTPMMQRLDEAAMTLAGPTYVCIFVVQLYTL